MKRLLYTIILLSIVTTGYGQDDNSNKKQHEIFIKAGFGTSWIILPKVFIVDADENTNINAQVLPAVNGLSGFIGVQTVFHLGDGWLFVPEFDLNYVSGEIRVNRTEIVGVDTIPKSAQNLQNYVRAEIPLHFGIRSADNFWVTFGPTLYFTLYDNKGFDNTVYELPVRDDLNLNSDNLFGVRFRLAAYAPLGDRSYIDIKFESDLGKHFTYENDTWDVKFSFQNISVGYGFLLSK